MIMDKLGIPYTHFLPIFIWLTNRLISLYLYQVLTQNYIKMPDFQNVCYRILKYVIEADWDNGVLTQRNLHQALQTRLPDTEPNLIKKALDFLLETGLCQRTAQPSAQEMSIKVTELGHEYYNRLKEYQGKPRGVLSQNI